VTGALLTLSERTNTDDTRTGTDGHRRRDSVSDQKSHSGHRFSLPSGIAQTPVRRGFARENRSRPPSFGRLKRGKRNRRALQAQLSALRAEVERAGVWSSNAAVSASSHRVSALRLLAPSAAEGGRPHYPSVAVGRPLGPMRRQPKPALKRRRRSSRRTIRCSSRRWRQRASSLPSTSRRSRGRLRRRRRRIADRVERRSWRPCCARCDGSAGPFRRATTKEPQSHRRDRKPDLTAADSSRRGAFGASLDFGSDVCWAGGGPQPPAA